MKKIINLGLLLFFASQISAALPPDKIYSITRVLKSVEYYEQQANLWQAEAEKTKSDEAAWFNLYQAARYANLLAEGEKPFDLEKIVGQVGAAIPNTAIHYFIRYIQAGRTSESFDLLLKANELAPENPDILHNMITYYEVKGNREEMRQLCKDWYAQGETSPGVLKWNYNVLMSVEPDALLLTWGDNDTYPVWMLQAALGVQPGVEAFNIWLLIGHPDYLERTFLRLNIPPFQIVLSENTDIAQQLDELVQHISRNTSRPVFLSPGMPQILRSNLNDQLFLTGLALQYSEESFDNMAVLKNNFENKMLKDNLLVDLDHDMSEDIVNGMNVNYLPPFLMLYEHYIASGETAKAAQMETILRNIATKGGREADLAKLLTPKTHTHEKIESQLKTKDLEKGMVKIKGNLYASYTELTNAQYEAFLMDLLKNKAFDLLDICKAPNTDWRSLLSENLKSLPDSEVFKNNHPDDPAAPVVNISHEAAKQYCDWITKVYNASTDKKKAHQKVRFRLPTEAEWELAAHAGQNAPYPWGGDFIRNSKGCFLANYDESKEKPCTDCPHSNSNRPDDGGFFSVKADAYFPNDFGLYNTSGNIAEMIDQPGITKGGSWAEPPHQGQIPAKNTYTEPTPFIGFRVFMEVIQ